MGGKHLAKEDAPSKKMKTTNVVILAVGIFAVAFIIAMIVIFCVKGSVPDTLIQYTLGAGGVEVLLCAAIKIAKVVSGEKIKEDMTDEEHY